MFKPTYCIHCKLGEIFYQFAKDHPDADPNEFMTCIFWGMSAVISDMISIYPDKTGELLQNFFTTFASTLNSRSAMGKTGELEFDASVEPIEPIKPLH